MGHNTLGLDITFTVLRFESDLCRRCAFSSDPTLVVILGALVQCVYIFDHAASPEMLVSVRY